MSAKPKNGIGTANALGRVRKYFPHVNKVIDARRTVNVSVTKVDSKLGRQKNPADCALAKACVRHGADGAIINIGYSYVIKGEVATRYKTSVAVGREITSFDRHHDFAAGRDYKLCKPCPSSRLGYHEGEKRRGGRATGKKKPLAVHGLHRTSRIRVSQEAV
jgi:hypothetical protein